MAFIAGTVPHPLCLVRRGCVPIDSLHFLCILAPLALSIEAHLFRKINRWCSIVARSLEAVSLRLRPIVMTSLAFIFGVLPLAFASGAGAEARKTIGWTVFGGMLAATTLAIFVVPVLYVIITQIANRKKLHSQ